MERPSFHPSYISSAFVSSLFPGWSAFTAGALLAEIVVDEISCLPPRQIRKISSPLGTVPHPPNLHSTRPTEVITSFLRTSPNILNYVSTINSTIIIRLSSFNKHPIYSFQQIEQLLNCTMTLQQEVEFPTTHPCTNHLDGGFKSDILAMLPEDTASQCCRY